MVRMSENKITRFWRKTSGVIHGDTTDSSNPTFSSKLQRLWNVDCPPLLMNCLVAAWFNSTEGLLYFPKLVLSYWILSKWRVRQCGHSTSELTPWLPRSQYTPSSHLHQGGGSSRQRRWVRKFNRSEFPWIFSGFIIRSSIQSWRTGISLCGMQSPNFRRLLCSHKGLA